MQLPIFPLAGIFLPPISNRAGLKIDSQLKLLQKELGYRFKDPALLLRCLTHVSYDGKKSEGHNEVLEFLGDAVLDLAVSDLLMRRNPDKSEGDLSKMRAALVNSAVLAEKAMLLKLGPALQIGKGEERSGGRTKPSILAGAFEATLARSLVVAFFLTMVLGLNESVSAQSMSVTIQMLRSAPVTWGWFAAALRREFTTALLLGLSCGSVVAAIVWFWKSDLPSAGAIGGSIALSLVTASLFGLGVPSFLHRLKLDPKIAAGPITLALADICALVLYFTAARLVLR